MYIVYVTIAPLNTIARILVYSTVYPCVYCHKFQSISTWSSYHSSLVP